MKKNINNPTVDYCLLLSAGLGERMGKIAKVLPKPLWPIFEKKLLELQISFINRLDTLGTLGIKKLFINAHHLHQKIIDFSEQIISSSATNIPIEILYEPTLLDIGGAIHNLASLPSISYNGNLLVVNSDQFLCFDFDLLPKIRSLSQNYAAALLGIYVPKDWGHNQLLLDEVGHLQSIVKNSSIASSITSTSTILTYSGMSIINLAKLSPCKGCSNFFESVANYRNTSVNVYVVEGAGTEYWDFGTLRRYYDSLKKLLALYITNDVQSSDVQSSFLQFCISENVFNHATLSNYSNSSWAPSTLNLENCSFVDGIYYEGVFEEIGK
ncbi:MAG: hypothetical protein HQK53_09535 [Oligoflexia bacterium]|nr:hypothetical protein [Oligoflexia bacterium]